MKPYCFVIALLISISVPAQKIFSENELVEVVRKFHPVARQAQLDIMIAAANLTASRGAFDPVISYNSGGKTFDGIRYYDQQWTELKIPTWYGIDLYTGIESMRGEKLNPEETKGTINYVGASIPLLQNVVIDKRRATVNQAKILREQSEVAREAALNDLLADALLAYWNWWEQHRVFTVIQASVQNARARLEMVKIMHQLGDRPAIDTVEAVSQVQLLEQQETEAFTQLQKSRLELSLYLWTDRETAYELPEDAIPATQEVEQMPMLDSLLVQARAQPILREFDFELQSLAIEKRVKFQSLLPEVRVKYNAIGRDLSRSINEALFDNNYRFGVSLSMPLRLSEGRGSYRAAKVKIEQTRLALASAQVKAENAVKQYYLEWNQTRRQYLQQQELVRSYLALQTGEETRFANGESSMFMINAREAKTIEAQRKELALAAKIQQAGVKLKWAAGIFGLNNNRL